MDWLINLLLAIAAIALLIIAGELTTNAVIGGTYP